MDFLQKPLAWSSKFYLGVQSKNCGRNNILIFFSEIFRFLSENFFRLSAKELQEVFKTTFYVSRGTVCGLNFFFKSFEPIWIFCRTLWHGFQTSIFVSRLKIPEEKIFYSSFHIFFGFWAKNFSDFWPKNFKKFSKLPSTCPEEQFVVWIFFQSFESFWIFCRNLWYSSQTSIFVSKVKIPEELVFLFFFLEFCRILSE